MHRSFLPKQFPFIALLVSFSTIVPLTYSSAQADTITYSFKDYPTLEVDGSTGLPDTVSGTIVTDGNLGALRSSDFVGGTLTFGSPAVGFRSFPVVGNSFVFGTLNATATQLQLPFPAVGTQNELNSFINEPSDNSPQGEQVDVSWARDNKYGHSENYGGDITPTGVTLTTSNYAHFNNLTAYPNKLSLSGQDPWVIAEVQAVPEPSSVTLLGSAMLGLAFVSLRRRRARA